MAEVTRERREEMRQWMEADGTKPHLAPSMRDLRALLDAADERDRLREALKAAEQAAEDERLDFLETLNRMDAHGS